MTSRAPHPRSLRLRLPTAASVSLIALLVHGLLAALSPAAGSFRKYGLAAEQFLNGQLPRERLVDFSPLYLEVSIWFERFFEHPDTALLVLQLVLVAGATGLFYSVLRSRFTAGLASLAVATMLIDRHLLVYERILEPEVFVFFFLIAVLYFLGRDRPLVAGLAAALSFATRPNLLPLFLLVPLDLYFRGWRGRQLGRRSAAFLLPLLVVLGLLMLRAERLTGEASAPVMNPGTVFFEGNNPLSHGTSAVYPPLVLAHVQQREELSPDSAHQHYRDIARADTGEELSISEVNAYWAGKAFAFIVEEPARFAELLLEKLVRSLHNFRWHDVPIAWQHDRNLPLPPVPFALLSATALLGLLFEASRWRQSLLFYALVAVQLGVMLVFYVSARQRLLLLPALLYFALVAIDTLRRGGASRRAGGLAVIALLTLALILPNDLTLDERYRRDGLIETESILHQFRSPAEPRPLAHHADEVLAALAASPWWLEWIRPAGLPQDRQTLEIQLADLLEERNAASPGARFDRAVIQLKAGRNHAAEAAFEVLHQNGDVFYRKAFGPSEPLFYLGRLAAMRGETGRAQELLHAALERSPGDPFVLAELAVLSGDDAYRQTLEAYFSALDARFLIGQAQLDHQRWADAIASSGFLVERLPDFRQAYLMLAVALGESGRLDEAARTYREAIRFGVEPTQLSSPTVEIFRRWAAAYPQRPEVQLFTAQVLHQHGRLEEALARLEAIEQPPAELRGALTGEIGRLRAALGPLRRRASADAR